MAILCGEKGVENDDVKRSASAMVRDEKSRRRAWATTGDEERVGGGCMERSSPAKARDKNSATIIHALLVACGRIDVVQ